MFGKVPARAIQIFYIALVLSLGLVLAAPAAAQSGSEIGNGLSQAEPAAAPVGASNHGLVSPVFGLATAPDGSLLVADAGQGIVELRKGVYNLVAELPGVTDMAPIGRGNMFAITGIGDPTVGDDGHSWRLYRVSRGGKQEIANLLAFETAVNPDGGEIDSNPFDVAKLGGGRALIADAGGNSLLIAGMGGKIDWVATLPEQVASTENAKTLVGCPNPPAELTFVCGLPAEMPAQPVATSVAVGPDGAYYVGELTGFPGPRGLSRVWRIEPGTRHAQCGSSPACTVVADGFTSIVDLAFGPDGTLYVVEMDEASFLAPELAQFGLNVAEGGTVNACDLASGTCSEAATELPLPIAAAVGKGGRVYVAIKSLMPEAEVIALP